ncbi:nuclear transport factor 2 family protein [Mucilaginibacter sabulilitoris]|uniref:Nuclear transport factor 2 family protein n=1 Tax=Mucilaginibacter sabulilitoris TaxID=1173583 RepID=A0ABZ0TGQ0_9SPHI|nr:nuclear transport factor 2 family protein [Mucilaginibacter sabulilitoris]WPU92188.1 nuclear transport factor 2 family protein [Mucilaginibacter sabulilitoris]
MKIVNLLAWGFCCAYVRVYPAVKANTIMDTTSNKQRVLSFYKLIVGQRKAELIPEFVREDYIQHNPTVKQGRAGVTEMINYLKTLPAPLAGAKSPIIRAIQEGDFVVTHLDIRFMGKRMVVIDLFKLKDGMLAEHWDAIQEIPDQTGLSVTATNGINEINESATTVDSKHVVEGFYNAVFNKQPAAGFIHHDYIEHDFGVIKSGKSLSNYLSDDPARDTKLYRIIGEGDFVAVQSSFKRAEKLFALYEIYRIADGKIIEHWSVEQVAPDGVESMF